MELNITSLRSYKIPFTGGMVAFDWISTIIAALIISVYMNLKFWWILILLLLISIILHYIFNIDTITNYYLGISHKPSIN